MPLTLEELFRAEYGRLVRALSVAAGGTDAAADAVQDAFVAAARHWRRISRYDEPAAWVRRVAVNRIRDQRRARRRQDGALRGLVAAATAHEDERPNTDLAAAIAALARQQRLVVCLHYLAELSVAEVADAMDIAEGTVKSHLHDARRALRGSPELQRDD